MCLFMSERELWKPSCKLLPVFQATVTNHPCCTVRQKAREYFTAKRLDFLTKRWTLVVFSSTWWMFWISAWIPLRDSLRGLSVGCVMDLKHLQPLMPVAYFAYRAKGVLLFCREGWLKVSPCLGRYCGCTLTVPVPCPVLLFTVRKLNLRWVLWVGGLELPET